MNTIRPRSSYPDTYIPHPAPAKTTEGSESKMGATDTLVITLVIPATISLLLYALLSCVVVPLWQRYRGRYSRYIPLDSISTRTTTLRQRLQNLLAGFLLPSSWRSRFQSGGFAISTRDGSDSGFDDEDGEELFEVDESRREALSLDARRDHVEDERRLSRDLEEGFRDDSDDDERNVNIAQVDQQIR